MLDLVEFGRTGHPSSRVLFGAAALGRMRQDEADAVLDTLLEFGVNHIDTAAMYGDSELRIAPWLARHRDRFFVATKTGDRTGPDARASLERSLTRLGVDRVDLIQLHNLVEEDEWRTALGPGGALDALVRARDEGLVRFIGATGHGLRIAGMHLRSIERFDFDSLLLPCNFSLWQHDGYRRDAELLMERCAQRRIAVQTIKSVARRRWSDSSAPHHSWYEPVTERPALARAVRWVLSRPGVFLNSSSDASLLRSILEVASGPESSVRPTDAEMRADVADLAITPLFDGGALERI
jgi:aryl-alcohol dehydrogenase-like predicted oxidoreductase